MKAFILVLLSILFLYKGAHAQNAFFPEPTGKVISDFENLLTLQEQEDLAADIKKSYNSSSNQLMVLCLPTKFIGQLSIEDYAQQLFKKWQPGQKGLNNGVLLIVTGSKTDNVGRKIRIHVGYGLEGSLPDLMCKHIQMQLMVPLLKEDRYAEGIRAGSMAILEAIKNENIGQQIKFRSTPKESIVLTDQLGMLSATEYENFENRMNVFYNDGDKPSVIQEYQYFFTDVSYAGGYSGDLLFELSVNHNLQFTSDTISKTTSLSRGQTFYNLRMNNVIGFDEKEQEENRLRVKAFLLKDDVVGAINEVISIREKGMSGGWAAVWIMTWIQLAMLFSTMIFWQLRKRKIWTKENVNGFQKFLIAIINVPILIINILAIFVIIGIHIALFSELYKLPIMWLIFICIAQEIICMATFFFAIDNMSSFFPGFSGGGGYQSSYSSSSSSSYSSSSSSSYSSSSSSNSNYGGGGGSSGGGGATSSW